MVQNPSIKLFFTMKITGFALVSGHFHRKIPKKFPPTEPAEGGGEFSAVSERFPKPPKLAKIWGGEFPPLSTIFGQNWGGEFSAVSAAFPRPQGLATGLWHHFDQRGPKGIKKGGTRKNFQKMQFFVSKNLINQNGAKPLNKKNFYHENHRFCFGFWPFS